MSLAQARVTAESRRLLTTFASFVILVAVAGCATERLVAAAPKGIDLTGEWQINPNLSDDLTKGVNQDQTPGATAPRRGRGGRRGGGGPGGGGGGGTGMPPYGNPGGAGGPTSGPVPGSNDFTSMQFTGGSFLKVSNTQAPDSGAGTASNGSSNSGAGAPGTAGSGSHGPDGQGHAGAFSQLMFSPDHMAIHQSGDRVVIQVKAANGELANDEYKFGTQNSVEFGRTTANLSVGWRGDIFVIDLKAKSGPSKEQDFGMDDDGRLIVTTFLNGGKIKKSEVKRVYDRVKTGRGVRQ